MEIVVGIKHQLEEKIYLVYSEEQKTIKELSEDDLQLRYGSYNEEGSSNIGIENFELRRQLGSTSHKLVYTQGSLNRLESEENPKMFIMKRIASLTKTVGYSMILVHYNENGVRLVEGTRLSTKDTIKAMNMYYTVNAKKDEANEKVIALEGTFKIIQIEDSKPKVRDISIEIEEANDIVSNYSEVTDGRREEYLELYNDLKDQPNEVLVEKVYGDDDSSASKFVRKKLKDPRKKLGKAMRNALILAAITTALGGYAANATGAINFLPENRVKVERTMNHTGADTVINVINSADSVTVKFKVMSGSVIVDGVDVANIKDEFRLLSRVNLTTNDGEEVASINQKFGIRYKYEIKDADGNISSKMTQKYSLKPKGKITDANGNTVSEVERSSWLSLSDFNIKNEKGEITFSIVKEPIGKTFSIKREKAGKSEDMVEALMQATALIRMNNSISANSNSSSSSSR